VVVRDRDWGPNAPASERKRVLDEIDDLGWPVFVKPARGGSSIGTSRVTGPADLEAAIEDARRYDLKVLVEAAIEGAEVECAVLEGADGGPPEASLPGQVIIDPHSAFYDFEAKYLGAQTSMVIPAPIPEAAADRVRQLACAAFDAISCEGLARVDFFYTPAGEILVNEINTMPGMTPASGFPMMWAASGLPLPKLIDRIITSALRKSTGRRLTPRQTAATRDDSPVPPPADAMPARPLLLLAGRLGGCPRGRLRGGRRLGTVHQSLEVRARAELRHRGSGHLDRVSGGRVTRRTRRALALLEDPESRDRDLVAACNGRLDGLEDCVQRLGRGLLVPQATRDGVDQITLVHYPLLRSPTGGRAGSSPRSRPLTSPKLSDRAPLHNNLGKYWRSCRP
jgi:hypothetical protein